MRAAHPKIKRPRIPLGFIVVLLSAGCGSDPPYQRKGIQSPPKELAGDSSKPSSEALMWKLKKAVDDSRVSDVDYLREKIFPELREVQWPNPGVRVFETNNSRQKIFNQLAIWQDGRYKFFLSAYQYSCLTVTLMTRIFGTNWSGSNATVRHPVGKYDSTTAERDGPNASLVRYRYYIRMDATNVEYIDFNFENLQCAQFVDFNRLSHAAAADAGVSVREAINFFK